MKRFLPLLLVFALGLCSNTFAQNKKAKKPSPALAPIEDVDGLPRVLLIGDSISIGYTLGVRKLLEGKANVHRPNTNCGPTTNGVAHIEEWLKTGGEGKSWDVIHFNWGLHDLKYMGADGKNLADPKAEGSHQQVPLDEYRKNLESLVTTMEKTGAKLIWRNTTPVPPGAQGRVEGDAIKYNEVAAEVMKAHNIPTHDLYTVAKERMEELQLPANVHFKPEGNEVLSAAVADEILQTLK